MGLFSSKDANCTDQSQERIDESKRRFLELSIPAALGTLFLPAKNIFSQTQSSETKTNLTPTTTYCAKIAEAKTIEQAVKYRDWISYYIGGSLEIVRLNSGSLAVIGVSNDGSFQNAQKICLASSKLGDKLEQACVIDSTEFQPCFHVKLNQSRNFDQIFQEYLGLLHNNSVSAEIKQTLTIEEAANEFTLSARGYWSEKQAFQIANAAKLDSSVSLVKDKECSILVSPEFADGFLKAAPSEETKRESLADISRKLDPKFDYRAMQSPLQAQVATVALINQTPSTTISVFSYDFKNDKPLVVVNPDELLQAASAIKVYVALVYFTEYKNNKVPMDLIAIKALRGMLKSSNNYDTNTLMRRLGGATNVEFLLKTHYGDLFKQTHIEELIPTPNGRTYKNKSTAREYTKYHLGLWKEIFPYSKEIKRLLSLPSNLRINVAGDGIPDIEGAQNKTGTTRRAFLDTGLLNFFKHGLEYSYSLTCIWENDPQKSNPKPLVQLTSSQSSTQKKAKGPRDLLANLALLINKTVTGDNNLVSMTDSAPTP